MNVTVTDPQNKIEVNEQDRFTVGGWPVAFTYGHGKNGILLQCNVFGFFIGIDGGRYLAISYTRPHILDKGKISKVLGRSIAAARLDTFFHTYFAQRTHEEGIDEIRTAKGLRIYKLTNDNFDYTINHKDGTEEIIEAPHFTPVFIPVHLWNEKEKQWTAARFERMKPIVFAKLYNKVMNSLRVNINDLPF